MLFYTVSPNNRSTWTRSQSPRISPIKKQNTREYLHTRQILQALHVKEYVEIENKKDELFKKKMEFLSMSKSLREVMLRETGHRQLKRYLVDMIGMTNDAATHAADKYNEGSRIYDKFPQVLRNLSRCPELDIRDLTIHELSLAGKPSWVLRRSALLGNKKKPSANKTIATPVDWADVQLSVDDITASQWFDTAKSNPPLVAYIMDKINDRVVNKAVNL